MKKKKVAVIGIGALGKGMVKVFFEHPLVELVAVCDTNSEKIEQCISLYNVRGFTNHFELLKKMEVDMVYVAVPPKWHHDIAIEVIRAGKHILCEKPLANSLVEAKNMLQVAKEYNVVHAMNFPLNYMSSTRKFEEMLLAGYIGKLRKIELSMRFPSWPRHWQQNSWINTREQGGFVFEVTGHFIQLIQRFFGPIHNVKSELEYPDDHNLPETGIIAMMRLENGVPITVNGITGIAGLEEQHLSLTAYGTKGVLSLQDLVKLISGRVGEEFLEAKVETNSFWNELINEFVKAIEAKTSELYDFQVGYDVQVVLEALRNASIAN